MDPRPDDDIALEIGRAVVQAMKDGWKGTHCIAKTATRRDGPMEYGLPGHYEISVRWVTRGR